MLSSVTLKCQATKIVMNSGSQLSKLLLVSHNDSEWSILRSELLVSQMSQVSGIVFVTVPVIVFVIVIVFLLVRSCPLITLIKFSNITSL